MRVSELSRASGASIPTIKFYLREGLLPPGVPIAPNQAEYSEAHLRRLRLVRAMSEVGDLPLRTIKTVLAALDDPELELHELLGVAHRAVGPGTVPAGPDAALLAARGDVDRFLAERGWEVGALTPAPWALAQALARLRDMGRDVGAEVFEPYALAAEQIAAKEVTVTAGQPSRTEALEQIVIGSVVFGAALLALRHLAQEHLSAQRLAPAKRGGRTPASQRGAPLPHEEK